MADDLKPYTKTSISSLINVRGWKYGLREIILFVIVGLLLLLMLIFGGLFGTARSHVATRAAECNSYIVKSTYCTSPSCIKTATYFLKLMNRSVDPCDNFYEYACGNYKNAKPVFVDAGERSVLNDMTRENQNRLLTVLQKPVSEMHDGSSETKLKQFFQSCNDMKLRETIKGTPFLTTVVTALGGWKLIGNWELNWTLNTALKKAHADFSVDVFYSTSVSFRSSQGARITISPGGFGQQMRYQWYYGQRNAKARNDYKKFMRKVGSLLLRDARNNPAENATLQKLNLEEFVNDTFSFESMLAEIERNSSNDFSYKTITLAQLTQETGRVIDFVDQLSYLYNKYGASETTTVTLYYDTYIKNVTALIASLPNATRVLHNYLIWRVAEKYAQYLSWEYVHANRELYQDTYGKLDLSPMFRICFTAAEEFMRDALNSLFVTEHFADESKTKVTDITGTIRLALKTQVEKTPWFDQKTKTYAKEKLDRTEMRIGYQDWMANKSYVDEIYKDITINMSDFFGNMMSANQLKRINLNAQQFASDHYSEQWFRSIYVPNFQPGNSWSNTISLSAGTLQPPVYHKDQQHFVTFGSLGSILGRGMHSVVGQHSSRYEGGNVYGKWWSCSSSEAYETFYKCVADLYSNVTGRNGYYYSLQPNEYTNGIRLAYIGYKSWLKSHDLEETTLPGLAMSNEQMMFLAHAQTICFDKESRLRLRNPEDDIQLNTALGQLQEFSDTFKCKPGSKLNHAKKCDYY